MEQVESKAISSSTGRQANTVRGFSLHRVIMSVRADFLDSDRCRQWVLRELHGDHPLCPQCGVELREKSLQRFWDGSRVRCPGCGLFFTALTGTMFSGCHMTWAQIVMLGILMANDATDRSVAWMLGMSVDNVRLWRLRFKALDRLAPLRPFDG